MITVIATYQLPTPITRDEARKIFLSTAPKYQGVVGLVRKYYVLSQDGNSVGGIYLWSPELKLMPCTPRVGELSYGRNTVQILRSHTWIAPSLLTT
jgi:hypothetical protein